MASPDEPLPLRLDDIPEVKSGVAGRHLPPRTRAFIEFMRPRLAREVAQTKM